MLHMFSIISLCEHMHKNFVLFYLKNLVGLLLGMKMFLGNYIHLSNSILYFWLEPPHLFSFSFSVAAWSDLILWRNIIYNFCSVDFSFYICIMRISWSWSVVTVSHAIAPQNISNRNTACKPINLCPNCAKDQFLLF